MASITELDDASVAVVSDDDGTYKTVHDVSEEGLPVTIALALSEVTGEDPEDLFAAFGAFVDPDALDRLFSPRNGEYRKGGPLYLTIADHEVTVFSDGEVHIRPIRTDL